MRFAGLSHTGEIYKPSPPGESLSKEFSDRGSTPLASTKVIAGRTPEETIVVFSYGVVLALEIPSSR